MRTRMVKTPDVELFVAEDGDPARPGILFLHGFPDSHRVWENQMRDLARDFHVITFDMRGCGNSGVVKGRGNYRIENILPDIDAVIDATRGPKGKVHLVGHDWGSVLGWGFVTHPFYSRRVQSWTSMSGPHPGLLWQWVGRKVRSGRLSDLKLAADQFAHSWYIFALNIPGAGRALFRFAGVDVWTRAMKQGGVPAGDPCLHITQEEVERITFNPIGLYQQNAFAPPPVPAPGSVRMPTQLIIPLDDAFVRPGLFEYLDEICTDLTRVTLDANHWAQRSHADEVTTLVRSFVARVAREEDVPATAVVDRAEPARAAVPPSDARAVKPAATKKPSQNKLPGIRTNAGKPADAKPVKAVAKAKPSAKPVTPASPVESAQKTAKEKSRPVEKPAVMSSAQKQPAARTVEKPAPAKPEKSASPAKPARRKAPALNKPLATENTSSGKKDA